MADRQTGRRVRYRVWITSCGNWQPEDYGDTPPEAVALEPAEQGTMSSREAGRYVRAFNRIAATRRQKVWAVAVPVRVCYEGDPHPGEVLKAANIGPPPSARVGIR